MGNDIHFYVFFSGSSTDLSQIPVSVVISATSGLSLSSNSSIAFTIQ